MTLIKTETHPLSPALRSLFGFDPFEEIRLAPKGTSFSPAFEVHESDSQYTVIADIPGVTKEEISIKLEGTKLVISGEREKISLEEGTKLKHAERFYGTFSKTIHLKIPGDASEVKASLSNGVLTVTIPKKKTSVAIEIGID